MSLAELRPRFNNRLGGWLPHDDDRLRVYILVLKERVKARTDALLPVVQAFKSLIENDGTIYSTCSMMIRQANALYGRCDLDGLVHLADYAEMCDLINAAVQEPPEYNDTDLVAFPINAIFDYSMNTPAGMAFFSFNRVNAALGEILRHWGTYLSSPLSLKAFAPAEEGGGGWSTPEAVAKVNMNWYVQPDPGVPGWGYASWNDWFIRQFKVGMRPIASPRDDSVIVSACESKPFDLEMDVQLRTNFWLKGQPYSLAFMLGGDETATPFIGGTVFQAFLSAFNYHRWHAPVAGTVKSATVIPGTYYAQTLAAGFDAAGPDKSQGFITNVAARAVFIIQADNPNIGEMALVAVGMSEVSSNIITAQVGMHVNKGQELGYFLFGGSTHCLVFRKDVIASWEDQVTTSEPHVIELGTKIATAV